MVLRNANPGFLGDGNLHQLERPFGSMAKWTLLFSSLALLNPCEKKEQVVETPVKVDARPIEETTLEEAEKLCGKGDCQTGHERLGKPVPRQRGPGFIRGSGPWTVCGGQQSVSVTHERVGHVRGRYLYAQSFHREDYQPPGAGA